MIRKIRFYLDNLESDIFIYDDTDESWESYRDQDQLDWIFANIDSSWSEMNHDMQCNNCMWTGYEEDLLLVEFNANDGEEVPTATENSFGIVTRISSPLENREFLKGCPNCKTDKYLINI